MRTVRRMGHKEMMYGKEYEGVYRTTYLINPDGMIANVWEKVKPAEHSEQVLAFLKDSGLISVGWACRSLSSGDINLEMGGKPKAGFASLHSSAHSRASASSGCRQAASCGIPPLQREPALVPRHPNSITK